MDRIGGFTVILATLLLVGFEPRTCCAQVSAQPATSIPPPRSGSDFGAMQRRLAPLEPTGPRSSLLVFPTLEERFLAAVRAPADLRLPISFATSFRWEGHSTSSLSSTPPRAAIPPPRRFGQSSPSTAPLPAGAGDLTAPAGGLSWMIKPAPLASTDLGFPINLATALRLSDARPLVVAAAQASVWVAEAQLTRAKVLWVPTLNLGGDYIRHDGGGPDFNKGVMTSPSVNFFYAGGGMDIGTLTAFMNLTDAYFEPLVARRVLDSRQWDIQTAKNDALLLTADAYFRVHQYRGMYAAAVYCVERGRDLVEQIASLSGELVSRIEVERARTLLADLEQQSASARQAWRVHSANLTQVLRLNPCAVVVPLERDHLQLTLIDPARPLPELQKIALTNRPELGSQRALVQAAAERIRREKMRPLLPIIVLGGFQASGGMLIQAGLFGLGANTSLNQWAGRDDVSIQLVWQFDALGIGNLARIKDQRGEQSGAIVQLFKTQDMVAAEVTEAQARLQSAAARVTQADRSLRTAIIAYNGNVEGLRHTTRYGDVLALVYRPQEVVYALRLLKLAFDEYFTTVADYNRAEFELFHALGYPAQEITYLRPTGNLEPIDTARPGYLPPVGNGPPPATR
ncbi:MAG: TolC family protein [Isosphaeraceae bacterium]